MLVDFDYFDLFRCFFLSYLQEEQKLLRKEQTHGMKREISQKLHPAYAVSSYTCETAFTFLGPATVLLPLIRLSHPENSARSHEKELVV